MSRELRSDEVALRLERLRSLVVASGLDAARAWHEAVPSDRREPLERAAARRLAELGALCELTKHLRRGRLEGSEPGGPRLGAPLGGPYFPDRNRP